MKILLPVDGSDHTQQMLEFVATQKAWLTDASDLTVLTVVLPLPQRVRAFMNEEQAADYYKQEAAAVLEPVKAFADAQGWAPTMHHRVGTPERVISDTATEGRFDLIVMGSHGHTTLGAVVLGSVTAKVLARCTVPVLVVRR